MWGKSDKPEKPNCVRRAFDELKQEIMAERHARWALHARLNELAAAVHSEHAPDAEEQDPLFPRFDQYRPGMLSGEFTHEAERLFTEIAERIIEIEKRLEYGVKSPR